MTEGLTILSNAAEACEPLDQSGLWPGQWWHAEGNRVKCDLCPRECSLKDGDRGFCFVRQNVGDKMVLTTYGRSTGFCIDPIEKKPLNHFLPGTSVLSFGTAGCNLGCKFCQNWDISKSREIERLSARAMPEDIARAAKSLGCASVAYTYNDPVIWAEYAIDTAKACRAAGLKSVAVTAGYITKQARREFYEYMDAANVDLKGFTEEFYFKITLSHLEPVLETLRWLKHETDVWFEITNLVIPDCNDDLGDLRKMSDWILEAVGDEVPVHFTAFHPDFRMLDRPNTPHETLIAARDIAVAAGLKYVYTGNVYDCERQSTYCRNCGKIVIERDWYELGQYHLKGDKCAHCGQAIPGRFAARPGTWGRKRQPVDMRQFTSAPTAAPPVRVTSQPKAKAPPLDVTALAVQQANAVLKNRPSGATQASVKQGGPNPMLTTAVPRSVELSDDQKRLVLRAAAEHVKAATISRPPTLPDLAAGGVGDTPVSGVFVSLKRKKRLRSCCGSFGRTMPLSQALQEAAHRTATNDPRFPPVSPSEIRHLDLEVWLLFAPEKIEERGEDRVHAVTIGKHGLKAIRGEQQGLLLPGVATDNGWGAEEFLNNVCIKAGLPPTAWKDDATTIYRFGGDVICGDLLSEADANRWPGTRRLYSDAELAAYVQYCRDTTTALIRGATPMYYCTTVSDQNVNGATVTVILPGSGQEATFSKLNIRQPMPLQSTLFSLCEELANTLRRRGSLSGKFGLDVAIFSDPAMHGTVASPDLGGIDPRRRGILITERNQTGWVFDANRTETELLQEAIRLAKVADPQMAQIFSLDVLCSASRTSGSSVPRGVGGPTVRPPGVAGKFYPSDVSEMNRMLDQFLAKRVEPAPFVACMVPHAGWVYSGQLAADVLKRIRFPKTIIAIGPKHTPYGVDWSVAPHQTWSLPGRDVQSDFELARALVDAVPGLQLDAAAHQQEHGVEVELPIIARLAPETRVVGVAIGGGTLERCEQFADGLAQVVRNYEEPPLLLISSDMNHFANDAETRRLDALALAELDRLDPDALLSTCQQHHISMCGVVPAVIILKTLQKLGRLHQSISVGYATSADATGDTSRVVGYAGRLFE